jgi:beta-glucosidase
VCAPVASRAFPEGFVWGTSTAAHQVEGGNWNNDWWAWEHTPGSPCKEPSGDACDHYHRYPEDIALLADLGFGAYRFSVEWSRIEPEDGEFSKAALDHYRRMCAACHEHGLAPVVTYHHFTSPRWVAARGGWAEASTADRFARFAERTAAAIGDLTGWACTFNEPNWVVTNGYISGSWPPGVKADKDGAQRARDTFLDAHRKSVEAIKSGPGTAPVGLTLSMTDVQAVDGGDVNAARFRRNMEDPYLAAATGDDFLGVQVYTRARVGPDGMVPPPDGAELTLMGYEFWPDALAACMRRAWTVTDGVPQLVTENGIGTDDDTRRIAYVEQALAGVLDCVADGLDVRGYCYWSALDNFEWIHGYGPTFGLVSVDRETQARTVKPSATWLGGIARGNTL